MSSAPEFPAVVKATDKATDGAVPDPYTLGAGQPSAPVPTPRKGP